MYTLASEHDLSITFGDYAMRDLAYPAAVLESRGCTFGIVVVETDGWNPPVFRKVARRGRLYDYQQCGDCRGNGRIDNFVCCLCEGHGRVESDQYDIT